MKLFATHLFQFAWLDRPIRQRGILIIAIPATCLFLSLFAIAVLRDRALETKIQLNTNNQILQQTEDLLKTLAEAETGVRGYTITRRSDFLKPYTRAKTYLQTSLQKMWVLVQKQPDKIQQLKKIQAGIQQQIILLETAIKQTNNLGVRANESQSLTDIIIREKSQMDRLQQEIKKFSLATKTSKKAVELELKNRLQAIDNVQILTLILGLLSAGASWWLLDGLNRELNNREINLQESKTRVQAVVDNAVDGILTLNEQGIIESCNPAAVRMFGWEETQIIGQNLRQLIVKPWRDTSTVDSLNHFLINPLAKLTVCHQETQGLCKDRSMFPIELTLSEMSLENQRRFIGVCRDISERRQAEEMLHKQSQLLDLANDTIIVLELDGTIAYWNQGARRLYGWRKSEVVGRQINKVLKTDFPQPLIEIEAAFLRDGYWEGELIQTKKDGTQVTVASRWSLQRDGMGQPLASLQINNDISDRKQTEAALAESEQRFRATFEQAAVGMAQTDLEGRLVLVNQKLCDFLGYSREQLLCKRFHEISYPEDLEIELKYLSKLLAGQQENYTMEKRFVCKNNEIVWSNLTVYLLRQQNGRQYLMEVVEDIRERKQVEAALRKRADELAQMTRMLAQTTTSLRKRNQELDQFAYVVSHDLKAPLRAIANLSSWIEEDLSGSLTEETQYQMNLLRGRVYRMEALIEGLLQYSRVGRIKTATETINVKELLADVIDLLAPTPTFTVEVGSDMPTLVTEKLPLQQVFSNLISNAIKHHRSPVGSVKISVKDRDDFYEFSITDDGPGIEPQYHEKIFVIFQTLEARDKVENTGIGLSLVKKIVENQGGSISIESQVGQGSTFRFTWPKSTPRKDDSA